MINPIFFTGRPAMLFNQIIEFIVTETTLATFILILGLAGIRAISDLYTHFFPKRGPDPHGDHVPVVECPKQTTRQQPAVDAQLDEPPQRKSKLRGQLKDATDARADAREKLDNSSGADDVPSLLPEGKAVASEVIFEEAKKRQRFIEGKAPKEIGAVVRHFGTRPVLDHALATSRKAVAFDLDRAEETFRTDPEPGEPFESQADVAGAYRNLAALDVKRGDLDGAAEKIRKVLELNMSRGDREGMAAAYTDLGNIFGIRGDLHGAMEMYRQGQDLYEPLGL